MTHLLEEMPRFLFLTGKGGVGKTSVACASAVALASAGRKVLLVSTDPASNVAQVFGQEIGNHITAISALPGLDALEIDPQAAAEEYRARALAPVRDFLSAKDLASATEQLSGSCTTEIAAFNEFTDLLTAHGPGAGYDHVVFDTAPTGHTVRLLKLPGEWSQFLSDGLGDPSCLGPMSGLEKTRDSYAEALGALADPGRTRLALVARAQESSLHEASRTFDELLEAGIAATHLVINGLLPGAHSDDALARSISHQESEAIGSAPARLRALVTDTLELRHGDMVGVDALRTLLSSTAQTEDSDVDVNQPRKPSVAGPQLSELIAELSQRDHGLVMVMGKGGVGKTTLASALAMGLADRRKDVLLTTTDPAAHLDWTIAGQAPFDVTSIDPEVATRQYRDHVMATKGASLDEQGRANLAEDLRSPCTEEVAVFQSFAQAVEQSDHRFVVMDTAPTGHTLLLMDATGSYHREVARNSPELASTTPLTRLRDPGHTAVIIATLPETTPVLEASGLQDDLERAGIRPWAWVINRSLSATDTEDPFLQRRIEAETAPIAAARSNCPRTAQVAYLASPPVGLGALRAVARHTVGSMAG
ncbi:arsenical pump-driving ATPase [Propionibacterium freudenreichii]|uniref:arsenical pump-driving ATPase n=2 Tax=Propionibacterium freudenreichii TaxID=1744 RepID=UPI00054263F5|nr:arsenical pump-driving ATPase [Propionibacterium freudenreichii]CEG88301.1 arsenite-transporting ATPase [Propionibacterium freudenreichii]